jgi:ABC-2 type transport system ATP-binding protein
VELSIDRLTKQFDNLLAVDRVSAKLTPGVYGLLGANGAGKTTLMRLICNILSPTSGEVTYNGKSISKLGESYRDILGYLPQNFGYYPNFTAMKFMLYIASLKGLPSRLARERSKKLLIEVGLSEVCNKKIKTFSGGMKQRLGIAQAMLNVPEILVLDEPTAGLDPKERVRFRNLISELSRDKIVILSTHIVSDVAYIANEILMMKKGQLIHKGTRLELLSNIDGKVWECNLPQGQAENIEEKYTVINATYTGKQVHLRIVADNCPVDGAIKVEANLEDLYLYYFGEEGTEID